MPYFLLRAVAFCFGLAAVCPAGFAQSQRPAASSTSTLAGDAQSSSTPTSLDPAQPSPYEPVAQPPVGKGEWVLAPVPSISPTQGASLSLIAQYIFHPAGALSSTPPSIVAGGVFYTQEESMGAVAAYVGHLVDDRWRPTLLGGWAKINVDYFGIGELQSEQPLELEQTTTAVVSQLLRRVAAGWYVGGRISAIDMQVRFDAEQLAPGLVIPDAERRAQTIAVGLAVQGDTRDNQFQPRRGYFFNTKVDVFDAAFGSDFDYSLVQISLDHFQPLGRAVLAWRAAVKSARGDVPFWDLSSLGQGNDIRGYEAGRYRDRDLFATQVEYRRPWKGRWGWVAFAGTAQVAPALDELESANWRTAGGVGLRFRIADDNPLNFRLDVATGEDGSVLYLGVGEAF